MSVICPYCQSPAVLTDSAEVYGGRSYGPIYLCRQCEAWVGCHRGTTKPLGRLADAELRRAKIEAHAAFDPTWKIGGLTRRQAYRQLAWKLGMTEKACHIAMFDVEQCRRVVEASKAIALTSMNEALRPW